MIDKGKGPTNEGKKRGGKASKGSIGGRERWKGGSTQPMPRPPLYDGLVRGKMEKVERILFKGGKRGEVGSPL